jgi:hypothetical protein
MSANIVYERAEGVITRRIAGETVVVPMPGSSAANRETRFFVLNGTAERLWEHLSSPQTSESMAHHLTYEFAIDAGTAREDILIFIKDLQNNGLIQVRGAVAE